MGDVVSQVGQFIAALHLDRVAEIAGGDFLDAVLYNSQIPSERILERYKAENAYLVEVDDVTLGQQSYHALGGNFLGQIVEYNAADSHLPVTRSLIRHNPVAVASALISLADAQFGK